MAHKVHPKGFRLRQIEDWDSRWIGKKKQYCDMLEGDFMIRNYLEKRLRDSGVENIQIERYPGRMNIIITSARPGLIIGRGGSGIEELRKGIESIVQKGKSAEEAKIKKKEIRLEIQEIKNPWTSASLTAQWVAQQLERRIPHRRVLKQTLSKVMANKEIKGARIVVSGRLGGADMSRRERVQEGQMPLQTLRANIDYSLKEAKTTYGVIGVKVWLYKGEEFE